MGVDKATQRHTFNGMEPTTTHMKATPASVAAFVSRIKPIVDVMWNTYGVGDIANSILSRAEDELTSRPFSGVSVEWSVSTLAEMEAAADSDIAKHRANLTALQMENYRLLITRLEKHNRDASKGLDLRKKVKAIPDFEEFAKTQPTF
jgi:hypothetical protein